MRNARLLCQGKNGTLKVCKGFPHGMCTTNPEVNADLLDFFEA